MSAPAGVTVFQQFQSTFTSVCLCTSRTFASSGYFFGDGYQSLLAGCTDGKSTITIFGEDGAALWFYNAKLDSDGSSITTTCVPVNGTVAQDPNTGEWLLEDESNTITLQTTKTVENGATQTWGGYGYVGDATTIFSRNVAAALTTPPPSSSDKLTTSSGASAASTSTRRGNATAGTNTSSSSTSRTASAISGQPSATATTSGLTMLVSPVKFYLGVALFTVALLAGQL